MAKALTRKELEDYVWDSNFQVHIWVEILALETAYPAIVDGFEPVGLAAIWCAGTEDDWLLMKDYGTKWVAYREKPEVSDRWNFVGAHLNGMEERK